MWGPFSGQWGNHTVSPLLLTSRSPRRQLGQGMGEGEARSSSSPPIPEVILGAVLGGTGAG